MFNQIMLLVYRLFLDGGGRKINWIERYFGYDDSVTLSPDDRRNEPDVYVAIFSEECRPKLELLYSTLLNEMKGASFDQSGDVLEAMSFLQEISAIALWKYRQNVGEKIEEFVRDFDRLDVPSERFRLYESAKKH